MGRLIRNSKALQAVKEGIGVRLVGSEMCIRDRRDIMGKVHFASSTVHSPWTALRVRWVPVYCFPTLSLRAFAMCAAFPRSDHYAQFDCRQGLGVSYGSPHCYSPPSLTSLAGSPVFTVEDSKQNAVGGVLLLAPSTLCGSPGTP